MYNRVYLHTEQLYILDDKNSIYGANSYQKWKGLIYDIYHEDKYQWHKRVWAFQSSIQLMFKIWFREAVGLGIISGYRISMVGFWVFSYMWCMDYPWVGLNLKYHILPWGYNLDIYEILLQTYYWMKEVTSLILLLYLCECWRSKKVACLYSIIFGYGLATYIIIFQVFVVLRVIQLSTYFYLRRWVWWCPN